MPGYAISGPVFEKVTIRLGNGKTLVLSAPGNSETNCYIKSIRFNGRMIDNYKFSHSHFINGGTVKFEIK